MFGAFANAAGMVQPVVECERRWQAALGLASPRSMVTVFYLLALGIVPLVAVALASVLSRRWAGLKPTTRQTATRFTYALVPLGFGMWLAHYSFHLFTSYQTIVPTTQRFAADLGLHALGEPQWSCACCAPVAVWLFRVELLFLDFGFLGSLYTAYRLAWTDGQPACHPFEIFIPWAVLITCLFLLGVWLVFQPMEMRGTMSLGGMSLGG